jgi:hypothetical protein
VTFVHTALGREVVCPSCAETQDMVTSVGDARVTPRLDDFLVCFNCGAINRFTAQGSLRPTGERDLDDLDPTQRDMIRKMSCVASDRRRREGN